MKTGVSKWNNLLAANKTSSNTLTYHIQPTDATLARLPQGNRTSPKPQLRTAIETLRSTLLLPAWTEHRKLPTDLTQKTTLIYPSWHKYINPSNPPTYTPTTYATLTSTPLNTTKPPKRPASPTTNNIPIPQHTVDTPLDTMEIDGHKHLPRQTIYHVSQWHTEHLTTKQLCTHINDGLAPEHLTRDHPEDEDTPNLHIQFHVTCKPAWIPEENILTTPSGKQTIDNYTRNKAPTRKKIRATPHTIPPTN